MMDTVPELLRLLEKQRSLYPSGIPLSVLQAPVEEEAAVETDASKLVIISTDTEELADTAARQLLHGAVEKGLKRSFSDVIWIHAADITTIFPEDARETLSFSVDAVIVCGTEASNVVASIQQSEIIITTVSLSAAARDVSVKRQLWNDLKALAN